LDLPRVLKDVSVREKRGVSGVVWAEPTPPQIPPFPLRPRALSTPSFPQLTRMRVGLGVIDLPVSEMIIRRMQ